MKELVIENTFYCDNNHRSKIKEYMMENDPESTSSEIKEKALELVLKEVERQAKVARELDDIEIEYEKSSSNIYEEEDNSKTN